MIILKKIIIMVNSKHPNEKILKISFNEYWMKSMKTEMIYFKKIVYPEIIYLIRG